MTALVRAAVFGVVLTVAALLTATPALRMVESTGPVYRSHTLAELPVEPENDAPGYWRPRWVDADRNCYDTAEEVELAEATVPAGKVHCKVEGGQWWSAYDGIPIYDSRLLDVDHVVALHQAWVSGAWAWPVGRYRAYTNDLDHPETLIAVTASSNRSKGDRDPAKWKPPNQAYWCTYAGNVVDVKATWGLTVDQAERDVLAEMLAGCR